MNKTTQEQLLDEFMAIAGLGTGAANATLGYQPEPSAFQAVASAAGSTGAATDSGGITAGSVVKTVLESGLGLVPLIGGLIGLFGGGGSADPPPLVKYAMPESIDFETAESGGHLSGVSYDQMGMPRTYGGGPASQSPPSQSPASQLSASQSSAGQSSAGQLSASQSPASAPPAQITVNVQAMDSRSFMDHSADIAAAVRNAMLNLNSINDVVNDL